MVRVHWTPLQNVDTLENELARLFETLSPFTEPSPARGSTQDTSLTPPIELEDTAEALILRVEMPGLTLESFDIEATVDSVTIRGDRHVPEMAGNRTRSEFRYGTFYRKVSLPVQIRNSAVSATYTNGVLSLTLPKAEADKHKVVKVTVH